MSRQYTKKSDYWNNIKKSTPQVSPSVIATSLQEMADIDYTFDENPHFSQASCTANSSRAYREMNKESLIEQNKFTNISNLDIPFYLDQGRYSISKSLEICYKAYFGVQLIRNYINMMVDFSKSPLHVKSNNKSVEKFYRDWLDVINVNQLIAEFFMEYYRSGNIFTYKFNGKIQERDFKTLKDSLGAKKDTLPIRYIILNPSQIRLEYGASNSNWIKILSQYEIARLRNPQTPEDTQVLESLPEVVRGEIKKGSQFSQVSIPLDPARLGFCFYKKQNYEPFAVPPLYGVLNDLEWKMELKRMDMALSKTIEQVILLVTTGDKPDQWQKGTNPRNLERLQSIFKNQTIGRVLVADYSTKAQWVIPDLKELLGNAKYERVNQDIKDGLQYMFFGEDKFANASIKVKMFIEALKEGRDLFLNSFLLPEVKKIAEAMNFKNLPEIKFEDISLQDESLMNKIYMQMAQLGLLTPEELNNAIETGMLPNKLDSLESQKEFVKNRREGLYTPMVGGNDMSQQEEGNGKNTGSNTFNGQQGGRPSGVNTKQSTKRVSPIGTKASDNQEDRADKFGVNKIVEMLKKTNEVKESVAKLAKKKWKLKSFNEIQETAVEAIAKSIILNEEESKWNEVAAQYLSAPKEIEKSISDELDEISISYDVDNWVSMVLFKSKV